MVGKRYGLQDFVTIQKQYSEKQIKNCDGSWNKGKDLFVGKLIRITWCEATWAKQEGLIPGAYRIVCSPPPTFFNGDRGIWIQGRYEPFKVFFGEFQYVEIKRSK
jgi:hypothetical protein